MSSTTTAGGSSITPSKAPLLSPNTENDMSLVNLHAASDNNGYTEDSCCSLCGRQPSSCIIDVLATEAQSILLQSPTSGSLPHDHKSHTAAEAFELCTTFVAVICLWGAMDDLVEFLVGESAVLGMFCYLGIALTAILGQKISNRVFRTRINLIQGLNQI